MKVCVVIGTRPQFIELAPIIRELRDIELLETVIYNTGQHYDAEMSKIFFDELDIPPPDKSFGIRPATHAQQTARIMVATEKQLLLDAPDALIVEGDTNTALGAALAASKLRIPIVHIEAGCRAFDLSLAEEVNRVIISHIASLHFAPTQNCLENLVREGIPPSKVYNLGHPLVDAIVSMKSKISLPSRIPETSHGEEMRLEKGKYYFVTIHRDHNVDDPYRLSSILSELDRIALSQNDRPLVFAVHPRTQKRIRQFRLREKLRNLAAIKPIGFATSLSLTRHAFATITDSGGLTKESAILGTPCVILRPCTEWVEALDGNFAQLAFSRGNNIASCLHMLEKNYDRIRQRGATIRDAFGRPGVSKRISRTIASTDLGLYPNQKLR